MKTNRHKMAIIVLSALLIVAIFIIILYRPSTSYDIVILGDSNIGNFRDDTGVSSIVAKKTGMTVFNGGFGGSTAVNVNEASFINLASAIAGGEFSEILSRGASRYDGDLTYYDQSLRELSYIDFNKVKVLVIAYGTNDQLSGASVDAYVTAVCQGIVAIKEKYDNLKIVVVTPFFNEGKGIDKGQPELEVYVAKLKDAVKVLNINQNDIVIYDGYNSGIVSRDNINEMTLDGIHLNEKARALYGEELSECISQ